jgi:hypothetical protein
MRGLRQDQPEQITSCHCPPPGRRNAPPDHRLQRAIQSSGASAIDRELRLYCNASRGTMSPAVAAMVIALPNGTVNQFPQMRRNAHETSAPVI